MREKSTSGGIPSDGKNVLSVFYFCTSIVCLQRYGGRYGGRWGSEEESPFYR